MLEFKLQNAASHKITVTATATGVLSLIDTAGSVTHSFPFDLSAVEINPEDYAVRYTTDGTTPTGDNGTLIQVGEKAVIECSPKDLRLIRDEATNAVCGIRVGWLRKR